MELSGTLNHKGTAENKHLKTDRQTGQLAGRSIWVHPEKSNHVSENLIMFLILITKAQPDQRPAAQAVIAQVQNCSPVLDMNFDKNIESVWRRPGPMCKWGSSAKVSLPSNHICVKILCMVDV